MKLGSQRVLADGECRKRRKACSAGSLTLTAEGRGAAGSVTLPTKGSGAAAVLVILVCLLPALVNSDGDAIQRCSRSDQCAHMPWNDGDWSIPKAELKLPTSERSKLVKAECCSGTCINLAMDNRHCGGCGRACASGCCFFGSCVPCSGGVERTVVLDPPIAEKQAEGEEGGERWPSPLDGSKGEKGGATSRPPVTPSVMDSSTDGKPETGRASRSTKKRKSRSKLAAKRKSRSSAKRKFRRKSRPTKKKVRVASACLRLNCDRKGLTCCGARCVNKAFNRFNCGACRRVCARGNCCFRGRCISCSSCRFQRNWCGKRWETCCGDRCVNLRSDQKNCGRCGFACPGGQLCIAGSCNY
ncbi:hypothetical protein CBR_g37368 [Chara braunii]|uniref:Uncharacterized protein n=1 Tax=Chara braunii TaxID=69332 RepID=A0A388JZS1_CHABU|nr:hypothetical protein CBR_g37368 [Chara braunii]|eukprot:GBG63282.1 hypothetical protein CBR_g37368 [Chara braunii]